MDPLHPITPGPPAVPTRRVPPVDRLVKISRDGDRPPRDAEEERRRRARESKPPEDGEGRGEGHIDVRV
jgi:hypothetical protein